MGEAVIAKMREAVAKSAPSLTRRAYGRVLMLMASTRTGKHTHRQSCPIAPVFPPGIGGGLCGGYPSHLATTCGLCHSSFPATAAHGVGHTMVYVHARWCMCMGMGTQKRWTILISHHVASHHIASTSAPTQARPRQGNAARHAAQDHRRRAHGLRQSKQKQETAST